MPLANISVVVGGARRVGVFGQYASLRLRLSAPLGKRRVWAQDLAGDHAVDITARVRVEGESITLPGRLIKEIGLSAATPGDLSEPGLILELR
jgi:hypothetical protein